MWLILKLNVLFRAVPPPRNGKRIRPGAHEKREEDVPESSRRSWMIMASKFNLDDFLGQRTKSEKILGFVAAFFIFFAVMQGVVMGPILEKIKEIDAQIETSRDEIRRDRRLLSFKDRIVEEYVKSSQYLDASEKSPEEIIATLLSKIEVTAQTHSITVKDIRPGETEVKPQFKVYKTSLDCEGTLTNFLAFMHELEQSDYLFQISKYSFVPKSKGAEVLKATLDIARYLIPAEKDGAKLIPREIQASILSGLEARAQVLEVGEDVFFE